MCGNCGNYMAVLDSLVLAYECGHKYCSNCCEDNYDKLRHKEKKIFSARGVNHHL